MTEVCINRVVSGDDREGGSDDGWIQDIEKWSGERKKEREGK